MSSGGHRTVLWEDNSKKHTGGLPKDAVVELWKERGGDASVLDATVKAGWQVHCTIHTRSDGPTVNRPSTDGVKTLVDSKPIVPPTLIPTLVSVLAHTVLIIESISSKKIVEGA